MTSGSKPPITDCLSGRGARTDDASDRATDHDADEGADRDAEGGPDAQDAGDIVAGYDGAASAPLGWNAFSVSSLPGSMVLKPSNADSDTDG